VAYPAPIGSGSDTPSPLVGRTGELESLLGALAGAGPALAAVAGPPGIGKTRLLAALAERRADAGALVLHGRAAEFEQDLPFAVWIDALDDHVAALDPAALATLGDDVLAELASVLPALAGKGGDGAAPLLDERHRVHAAMRTLLELLAAERPLLVVLDDLHWGDPGSIDLTASLLRRPPAADVALVAGLRPGQAPDRLAAALDRAERDGGLLRLTLAVLDDAACDALLGDAVASDLRAELRAESGGNPFYLQQLARAVDAGGTVPRGVSDAIAEELRALPPQARRVLEGAAVVGDPFDPALAAAAAETDAAETAEALDELARRDLVHPAADHGFALRHPLVRRAVYESTGAGWRLAAHGRVAAALRERGAGPALLAHHVARSAEPGDAAAVALLREGALAVLDRAPSAAAEWLAGARALQDGGAATDAERLELLEPLGAALAASGSLDEAHAALAEAVDLAPRRDLPRRVAAIAACAALEHRLGRHEDAERRLRGALAEISDARSAERMPLLLELAAGGFYRVDLDAMSEHAAEALAAAETAGDGAYAFAATAALALADVMRDRVPAAQVHWEAATAALDALPDEELARRLDGVHFLTLAGMYLERFAAMNEHAQRGIRVARASRQGGLLPVLTLAHGYGAGMLGELAESTRVLDGAIEAARVDGSPFALAWVLMNAAMTAVFAGDIDRAMALGEEGLALAATFDDNVATVQMRMVIAEALAERGSWDRAHEELLAAGAGPEIQTVAGFWRCYCLDLLARVELECGRTAEASVAVERAQAHAAGLGLPLAGAWAERAQARVALAAGDAKGAAELALSAATGLERGAAPVEAARARTVAARALATSGDRDAAVAQLEQAVAALDRCGAAGYRAEAARELRRLGRRPVRGVAGADGLESLSGREREVADLVADGSTNGQIAEALYLSPKTVETHLRNIFAKLRVSSRLEVARIVDRESRSGAA
jgi:DNA-binding CsgD family transcriptional regulator